jgi:hypothetical protein
MELVWIYHIFPVSQVFQKMVAVMLLVIDQPRILLSLSKPVSYFSAIIRSLCITITRSFVLFCSDIKALATADSI